MPLGVADRHKPHALSLVHGLELVELPRDVVEARDHFFKGVGDARKFVSGS
jgi:hypothetical protein